MHGMQFGRILFVFVLISGCQRSSGERPAPAPVTVSSPRPSESEPETDAAPPGRSEPTDAGPTAESACEKYLAMYERCEPKLEADIQSGNMLRARNERARLEHMKQEGMNASGLEVMCHQLHSALASRCEP